MEKTTSKFCPQCGQPLAAGAKFCTHCGYHLKTPTATAAPDQTTNTASDQRQATTHSQAANADQAAPNQRRDDVQRVKRFSGNYFAWWLATVKHPTQAVEQTPALFGGVTYLLAALFPTLGLMLLGFRAASAANQATNLELNLTGIIWRVCVAVLIVLLLTLAIYAGVGYGFRRLNDTTGQLTFKAYATSFAGLLNLGLAIEALGVIVSLFTPVDSATGLVSWGFLFLLIGAAMLILNMAFVYSVVSDTPQPRWDTFYLLVVAIIALSLALGIFSGLVGGVIGSSLENTFSQIFDSYGSTSSIW
ncbi:zinc ribbon domain-containing protein [Levilactobacillus namurensis]|uniref:zinc ribbon domain-containing protein n=1 Tax=Levilactobacillus namurensis TaxID=380393 RepID=UPI00046502DE|nr:zinc ribbon domain-containing protein [Levilactobacillus namurensis]